MLAIVWLPNCQDAPCATGDGACDLSLTVLLYHDFSRPPDRIDGLGFWIEGDRLSLPDGSLVSNWPDLSSNGFDATQPTMAEQPTYNATLFGSRGGVTFNNAADPGTNLILGSNYLFSNAEGMTIVGVARSDTEDSNVKYLLDFGKNGMGGYGMMYSSNSDGVNVNLVGYTPVDAGGASTSTAAQISTSASSIFMMVVKWQPASESGQTLYLNGSPVAQGSVSLTQITSDEICRSPTRGGGSALPLPPSGTTCSGGNF